MSKSKKPNIFTLAKKLREQYPRKFKQWQQYVQLAKQRIKKEICTDTRGPVNSFSGTGRKKTGRKAVGKVQSPARTMGSIAFHKSQARKQTEEKLAWLLLARDQEKRKGPRLKLSKKVALLRQDLHKLK